MVLLRRNRQQRGGLKENLSVRMISIPLIAVAVNGDRGDSIVPTLGWIIGKPDFFQVVHVMLQAETSPAEIGVLENADAGVTKDADRADFVVESGRQRRPPLSQFQTEIISPESSILVKASPDLWRMGSAPPILGP